MLGGRIGLPELLIILVVCFVIPLWAGYSIGYGRGYRKALKEAGIVGRTPSP